MYSCLFLSFIVVQPIIHSFLNTVLHYISFYLCTGDVVTLPPMSFCSARDASQRHALCICVWMGGSGLSGCFVLHTMHPKGLALCICVWMGWLRSFTLLPMSLSCTCVQTLAQPYVFVYG